MMKNFILLTLLSILSTAILAQEAEPRWKAGGTTSLNFSQATLTNWAAGGENTLAGNALVTLFANYKNDRHNWDNSLTMGFGLIQLGDEKSKKSEDKIDFASIYGYHASKAWYYSALFTFKTQFYEGYDYKPEEPVYISNFMAPAYIALGVGMEYKPSEHFSAYLSPITSRLLIINDKILSDAGAFGMIPGDNIKHELGANFRMLFNQDIMKNVNLQTKLELFSDYLDHPERIDVSWELIMAMKVNSFITTNISTNLLYDHDIQITDKDGKTGPRTQFKEVLSIGLTYSF